MKIITAVMDAVASGVIVNFGKIKFKNTKRTVVADPANAPALTFAVGAQLVGFADAAEFTATGDAAICFSPLVRLFNRQLRNGGSSRFARSLGDA
jgi:hypothetical protein